MDPSSTTDFDDEIDGEDDEVVLMDRRIKCPIHDHSQYPVLSPL